MERERERRDWTHVAGEGEFDLGFEEMNGVVVVLGLRRGGDGW